MNCDRGDLFALALDDDLTPDEHAEVDAHLADCGACREALADVRGLGERLRALPPEQPSELGRERAYAAVLDAMRAEAAGHTQAPRRASPSQRLASARPAGALIVFTQALAAAACLMIVASLTWDATEDATHQARSHLPAPEASSDARAKRQPADNAQDRATPTAGRPRSREAAPAPPERLQPRAPSQDPADPDGFFEGEDALSESAGLVQRAELETNDPASQPSDDAEPTVGPAAERESLLPQAEARREDLRGRTNGASGVPEAEAPGGADGLPDLDSTQRGLGRGGVLPEDSEPTPEPAPAPLWEPAQPAPTQPEEAPRALEEDFGDPNLGTLDDEAGSNFGGGGAGGEPAEPAEPVERNAQAAELHGLSQEVPVARRDTDVPSWVVGVGETVRIYAATEDGLQRLDPRDLQSALRTEPQRLRVARRSEHAAGPSAGDSTGDAAGDAAGEEADAEGEDDGQDDGQLRLDLWWISVDLSDSTVRSDLARILRFELERVERVERAGTAGTADTAEAARLAEFLEALGQDGPRRDLTERARRTLERLQTER